MSSKLPGSWALRWGSAIPKKSFLFFLGRVTGEGGKAFWTCRGPALDALKWAACAPSLPARLWVGSGQVLCQELLEMFTQTRATGNLHSCLCCHGEGRHSWVGYVSSLPFTWSFTPFIHKCFIWYLLYDRFFPISFPIPPRMWVPGKPKEGHRHNLLVAEIKSRILGTQTEVEKRRSKFRNVRIGPGASTSTNYNSRGENRNDAGNKIIKEE